MKHKVRLFNYLCEEANNIYNRSMSSKQNLNHMRIYIPSCWMNAMSHWNFPLLWPHNGRDGASNHQPHDCLLNRSFRRRSRKTSKLCVTGLCAGNSQMASNAGNVSIWWRYHAKPFECDRCTNSLKQNYSHAQWNPSFCSLPSLTVKSCVTIQKQPFKPLVNIQKKIITVVCENVLKMISNLSFMGVILAKVDIWIPICLW